MKYFVKYIANGVYRGPNDTVIPKGTEKELTQEMYEYLNSTFGDSGWFTFRTEGAKAKAKPVAKDEPTEDVKVETPKPKRVAPKRATRKKD